ncbi:hypothetical protein DFH09DRAFT_1070116 [Mycena vulgaris]|nr:hypothetical protein DFH09DRAFT_1070116 [Mycena vulgaris]
MGGGGGGFKSAEECHKRRGSVTQHGEQYREAANGGICDTALETGGKKAAQRKNTSQDRACKRGLSLSFGSTSVSGLTAWRSSSGRPREGQSVLLHPTGQKGYAEGKQQRNSCRSIKPKAIGEFLAGTWSQRLAQSQKR